MTVASVTRKALLVIGISLLLGFGWIGLSGGATQIAEVETVGQAVQTVAQFAFGLFALLAAVTVYWARRLRAVFLRSWEVSVAVAGGTAPVAWGDDTSVVIGLVAGGAAFLVAWVIGGLVWVGTRHLAPV